MINEKLPPETKEENKQLPIVANGRGLVLRSMDDIWRFACAVKKSGLAPSSFTTPEQILIAIQSGAELSMPPMRSLQSFCVVNGQARLWGDAPLALVRQSGLMEYIKEEIIGEDENMVAQCESKRKDSPNPVITTFSVEDAKKAGLWAKRGTWTFYPKRMLKYRARSFNLRDNFPDAFGGATIAEEYEGIELPTSQATPEVPTRDSRKPAEGVTVKATKEVVAEQLEALTNKLIKLIEEEQNFALHPIANLSLIHDCLTTYANAILEDNEDYQQFSSWTVEKIKDLDNAVEMKILPDEVKELCADPLKNTKEEVDGLFDGEKK